MSTTTSTDDGLSGPAVVSVQWPQTMTLPSTDNYTIEKVFYSYDQTTRYLIWMDGFAQCPNGVANMDIMWNGKKLVDTRPLKTSTVGTTALSMNSSALCTDAQLITNSDGSTAYKNVIALVFKWTVDDTTTITAPTVQGVSISMLPVASLSQQLPPSDDKPPGDGGGGSEDDPIIL